MTASTVASFYKFVAVDDCAALAGRLRDACAADRISGTILIANEGINGTIAGDAAAVTRILDTLRGIDGFADLEAKLSSATEAPFQRLKIKIKPEIVTLGVAANASTNTGRRVQGAAWNALISDPDVVVVDTRNHYEVAIGSFPGAIDPETESFQDFPAFVDRHLADNKSRPIAMFCTGGIRCEKASAMLVEAGFENVFQLDGGILKYLEDVPVSESLWQGECFVFDGRVSLKHGVVEGSYGLCRQCGAPCQRRSAETPPDSAGPLCDSCCNSDATRGSDET